MMGNKNGKMSKGWHHTKKAKKRIGLTQKGEKNCSWKGGITSLYLRIRRCFEYRQWRSDVFTRDNFTCQDCGDNKGGNLKAHHRKSFSSILQYYEITTIEEAINCEELWNINNGITLCEDCHKKLHKELKKRQKYIKGELSCINI